MMTIADKLRDVFDSAKFQLSDIRPSDWAEKYRVMSSNESSFEGRFSYDLTPYCREIVDCMSQDHPARIVAVMKGAQVGFSTGVIEPAIGWTIAENPGNILFLTGHSDLAEESITKLDTMIDSCGIRHLIKPQVMRKRSNRTGDTNTRKEFAGGSLISGSAGNHKLLRQRSVRVCFIDDFDAAKGETKESGATTKMIEQRLASHMAKMKLFYISTPELKETSNIEPVYLQGDQRKYHVPCPCCGELIDYQWQTNVDNTEDPAGIVWELDENNELIPESVGYRCQRCGGFFDDRDKYERNLQGVWVPTTKPKRPGYYSYHLNALYAPPGMYDWEHYVRDYLDANPPGQAQKESLMKTFANLCLGDTFEPTGESPDATSLQQNNERPYDVGIIPEKLSIKDGNGDIMLLTCAADLNGKEDDARLDYEVLAHSESGSTYSICHGSIGTFVRGETKDTIRKKWTYRNGAPNNVWTEFKKVIDRPYKLDNGNSIRILITGVDAGYLPTHVFDFIDKNTQNIVGLKGSPDSSYMRIGADRKWFKLSQEKSKLYLLQSNLIKDEFAELSRLNWNQRTDDHQPAGYLNFPRPSNGLYGYRNFYSQLEAEKKVVNKNKSGIDHEWTWVKKRNDAQNHLFDCRCYNMALREIMVSMVMKAAKRPKGDWDDFCQIIRLAKRKN